VELDQKRFALRLEEVSDQLDGRIEKTELLLRQAQDYLMLTGEDRRQVFREWLDRRGPGFNFPWVHGIAVATNRLRSQWRRQLPQPAKDWTQENWETFQKLALAQPVDCVLALKGYLRGGWRFLEDYDLRGVMTETNAFTTSVRAVHPRISDRRPVMLDARSNVLVGVLMYAPVHQAEVAEFFDVLNWDDSLRGTARWLHLDSMIVVPIDFHALERAVWDGKESDLGVELFSSTNQTAETWLNISGAGPLATDARFKPYLARRVPWPMYGRKFSMFIYSTPLFEAQSPRRMAWVASGAATGVTLLASALVGVALRARLRQEGMAVDILEARDALAAAAKERVKLGHDLHDGAIQSLYAVQLGLTRTAENVEASLPNSARVLNETRERVDEVIAELRRFLLARESGEESIAPVGLDRVLGAMVERLEATTAARLSFNAQPGAAARLSTAQAVQLTQLARSALANCLRHAGASEIVVTLGGSEAFVRLEITDNGAGFDLNQPANGGMGLHSMRSRAVEAGGTLEVHSHPGQGTRIVVSLPVSKADLPSATTPPS